MAVKYGFLLLLHVLTVVQVADAACANSCSGHGRCGASNQCTCDSDWAAPDCSLRKCPTGVAWTDKAKTANVAHAVTECSNRGVCDYSKGECTCFNGYTGAACQRLRCPSDCSGHGLCYSSATLSLQYGPDSLPSVAGDGIGPVYSNWEKDSMSSCLCDMGYTGPDCSQLMCAKNDDPLTMGQGYRTIQIQVGADALTNLPLAGSVRIHFLGDVAVFNAVAVADAAHEQACAKAFQAMRTVLTATCTIASVDPVTAAATYTVKFTEWTHLGGENNLLHHSGNPALTSFTCDLTQVTSLNTPTCAITDVTATNVIEHIYCSNRGLCDFSTGQCVCYADFKGMDCNQPSNVPDSIDENDGFIVNPMGLTYTGTVLNLKTAKGSQADFYFMKIGSSTKPILTMNGMGDTKLLNGNLEISTGTLTVTTEDQTSTAADIANTHTWFTGTALKVRTTRSSNSGFKMFEAITGTAPTTIVDIRGDGLTTIYKGGLSVVTGGGTISHTSNGPSLTVTNSDSTFSSSLLKLTTSRATRFPGATDFIMIEATANSVSAFTVEASGRTTIANGGLIVSNADATSSVLNVSATATTFAGDAVAIKTFSSAAHNMLRITTEVGSTTVDLVTIRNSGLTTITKGGLDIRSGGATIESGGLRIVTGGETIEAGGLIIEDGGETILAGGLNVVDGGGAIASVSSTADILTVEATSDTFSNNARVLHIDSKSTVDPSVTMHYLIEATVGASSASVFKVDATGLATFAGQSSGGAKISDLGTTANTLTVTNSATGFNKALLALVSALSSTFSVIEATVGAGATSVFKVASSGLTTTLGLEVTTSGASITGGLKVLGTGASINGGLKVLDTGASISGGLKVLDTGASVNGGLKVLDTGATISGGVTVSNTGLTVTTGGATITDTGTITNTLTVTNSATGFNKALLALVSTATSTFSVIDATVSGTSVFNVLSSGLTTIVGRGSGGAVISDSSPTTTSTLSVTNTAAAAAAFTGAILSVDTTALTEAGAFSIIDARVLGISKFTVEASGKTTIAGGGLTINGGLTVVDTGVTVSAGDVLISSTTPATSTAGALVVKGGGSIALGLYVGGDTKLLGKLEILASGTSIFKVDATGLTTIVGQGSGGATIFDSNAGTTSTLAVANTAAAGAAFTGAVLSVDTTALTDAGGFSLIDARVKTVPKFTVAASGATTIAGGGLSVKGGVTVVDTGVTVSAGDVLISSTTPATSTAGALVVKGGGSIALGLYVGGDTKLLGKLEILASGTSIFKVDATGLTTIVGQGSGGATIFDSNAGTTSTLAVANTAAAGAAFTGAVLSVDTTALTDAGGFSLIDARVKTVPKFTVAASGATTIAGGGLSVKGGVTVVDTGVTVSAGDVLISSTTPATSTAGALVVKGGGSIALGLYVGGDTKLLGKLEILASGTSIFKVDATGLTTIVGQGSGGATIFDSNAGTTSTLAVANTAAAGAAFTGAVLSVDTTALTDAGGFSLIDARVKTVPKFTVAASGATTIAGGGLSVKGGVTVVDTGVTVSAGDVLISSTTPATSTAGALVVKGGGSIALGLYVGGDTKLLGKLEILASGTSIFKVDATGLTTIVGQGSGGATIFDSNAGTTSTLAVANTAAAGAAFTGAVLSVDTTALTDAGGFSLIDARVKTVPKFTVAASGKTTIAGGGLDILATGTSVFTVAASGATTIAGGGLSVKGGVTVVDTGVTVSAGDVLISSTTPATSTAGALVVKGGGSIALGLYVGGDTKLLGKLEILASGTSIFKVDATGLTTIVGQGSGGATIFDSNAGTTSTLAVANTAAAGAAFTGAVLSVDTTALTDAGGFSLIDARVKTVPKFTVAASGKTTIAGGGLSVKGGVTVVDTGVTVSAGDVLISSTTPATSTAGALVVKGGGSIALGLYVGGDTKLLGKLEILASGTSIFKVDATGLTTIVGQGSGGATIFDSNAGTTSTLAVANTAAAGAAFTGAVLSVDTTALTDAGGFSLIDARVKTVPKFTVAASGATTIAGGGLSVKGGVTVVDTGVTVSAGDVLISSTTPATSTAGALVVKGGGSIALGLYVGDSLSVVTGGGTISHTSNGPSLTVTNSDSTFSSSLLKLTTSRATRFPGATDFIMIEATANSVSAFTVEASGRTTIANGGLIVSNADATSSVLNVSATATTFAGDAVAIKTFSSAAHNMLRITTEVGSTTVDLVTIRNSGLTTITKGGLDIGSGGATIESGGLRIITGGETIEAGGLNVVDGGGKIASVSSTTDTLAVTNTAAAGAAFTGAVLSVDTTALTDAGGFSLIDARVKTVPKFTVAASGKTTIAGGGLDILATGTSVFTVAASGATTIAGGGLSVKGGVTVVDTGVTVSAGDVLISSTTPATSTAGALVVKGGGSIALGLYVGGDTKLLGKLEILASGTSIFKVDATGLTTIVGQGSGGATIFDSNAGTTSTLAVANTAAAGAAFTGAVLSVDTTALTDAGGFSLIDARVKTVPKFTVAASGATTIAGGGLSVKGGVTVVDTGVTVSAGDVLISSTTPATSTAGALVVKGGGSIALGLYVGGDTKLLGKLEILASGTSIFKVDATGLTTIVGQGSGGATIFDSNAGTTSTLAVANTAAAGAAFTGAVLSVDTTALTDAGGFSLIDARVKTVPKFTVAASGATTIAGGGLSVKGGVTVVDTGVTVSAGDVLISSTTPATSTAGALVVKGGGSIALGLYVGGDTKLLGKLEILASGTSIFKVDATGLTTIVGQGSGGATIFDSNAGTTSTLAVANTAAAGAAFTGAVLSVDTTALTDAGGFSLIDARVKTVPKFTVAASGKTTIAGGGLSVKGGVTVVDTGVTVSAGDVLISSTTPATSTAGALVVKGGGSIALGLYVGGDTNLLGKLDVTGLTTIVGQGSGGATIFDSNAGTTSTLAVANTAAAGAAFTGAVLSVDTTALTDAGGFSLIDARVKTVPKFTVAASGATTIAGGGLSVKGGVTVVDTGVTVSAGDVLISSTTPATSTAGALVVKGGGSIALGLYVGGDTNLLGKLDVTGLTTIVGQGSGGATIFDSNAGTTSTLAVANTAAAGAAFTGAVLSVDTTALTDAGGFSLIDARVKTVPKFTVAASGATTIAGGGLSVKGGVTVVDTGVTVSAGDVLISSTTPATSTAGALVVKGGGSIALGLYVGGDTNLLGKLDVTGLTTIVGQGSGGATIFDSNAGTTSTLAVANTAAAGAAFTGAVLSVDTTALTDAGGFSLIDARVKTVPKFTVAASGATTIAGGGLSVKGGVTVVDTGVTVSAGDVLISSTTPATSTAGALVVKGGGSIALGLYVGGDTNLLGKLDVTGLTTIVGQGSGGATIFDSNAGTTSTLAVANTAAAGAAFTGAVLSVDTTALTDAGGFSLIDARVKTVPKFTVAASGKTTIAGGGLDILATGTSVFTVAASGATTIAGGGLSVKGGVTVVDTGVTVSAGDVLISSTTEESGVNTGALVVKGGGSFARNLYVGGTIHNTSDRRLKTAVQPLESSRAFIQQLRPVTYEWRRDEFPSRNFPEGVFPGFLADEVEKVLPDLVQEDGSGWKSLNYVGVIPYLVRAVQELQDQVETAETLMARMQQQLDALSKR